MILTVLGIQATAMRVTVKGQVTIPHIRELTGIRPHSEVEFYFEDGKVWLIGAEADTRSRSSRGQSLLERLRGTATASVLLADSNVPRHRKEGPALGRMVREVGGAGGRFRTDRHQPGHLRGGLSGLRALRAARQCPRRLRGREDFPFPGRPPFSQGRPSIADAAATRPLSAPLGVWTLFCRSPMKPVPNYNVAMSNYRRFRVPR
jgi:bifunctional DNA-binding transcriptional regulator/antitoxin component of YhaV-PrlF toxin-antitoxin module